MPISRQKKEEIIQKVADIVKNSQSVVFVNFHGLSVVDANEMRQELRNQGVSYVVVKKTLVRRVLEGSKIEGDTPALEGELALAYGDDMIAPAKGIVWFQKKLKNVISPIGGIMEGRYLSVGEIKSLAAIPEREVLYGQFVTVINTPIQQTAGVLNEVLRSFVGVLNQVVESKS